MPTTAPVVTQIVLDDQTRNAISGAIANLHIFENEARRTGTTFAESTFNARASIQILSQQLGLEIPRHLQTLAGQIPIVSRLLGNIGVTLAVGGIAEGIGAIVSVVKKYQAAMEEAARSENTFGVQGQLALRKIDEQITDAEIEIDKLTNNHVKLLRDELTKLNEQNLDTLLANLKTLNEIGLGNLTKQAAVGGFLTNLLGITDTDAIKKIKDDFVSVNDEIQRISVTSKNASEDIGKLLGGKVDSVKKQIKDLQDSTERILAAPVPAPNGFSLDAVNQQLAALKDELTSLQQMQIAFGKVNELAADKTTINALNDNKRAASELSEVLALQSKVAEQFADRDPIGRINESFAKLENELSQQAIKNPAIFRAAFPNDTLETVIATLERLKATLIDEELLKGAENVKDIFKQLQLQPSGISIPTPALPTLAPDAHTLSSLEKQLDLIRSVNKEISGPAAASAARSIVDSVQTENEKFQQQVDILRELQRQGLLTADQVKQAIVNIDPITQAFASGFDNVFQSIALGTRSVGDAFASLASTVAASVLQMVAKLLILPPILRGIQVLVNSIGLGGFGASAASAGSVSITPVEGFGGIPSFGGGRASGGPVMPNSTYLVGEHGPELLHMGSSRGFIGGTGSANVQVNVINRSSQPVSAKVGPSKFDGRGYVTSVILEDLSSNGPIRQALGSQ